MLEFDLLKLLKDYGFYVLGLITALYEKKYMLLFLIFSLLLSVLFYDNFGSKHMQNKRFIEFIKQEFEKNTNVPYYNIMSTYVSHFSGEEELVNIAEFFTRLTEVDLEIYKKYKNDVSIWQVVVNDMPSYVYQLNNDKINNLQIQNKTNSMVQDDKKEYGFSLLVRRKDNFDNNPIMKHISIYWKDGINQKAFEDNVQNTNGVHKKLNETNQKIINNSVGKINGIRLNEKQRKELIHDSLRGQFTIIKKKNGVILLFIESNGEQKRETVTTKDKTLRYYKFYNKNQIKTVSYLYKLLDVTGILDSL